ncbi:UNKNOWN [Stylonychia lemnae]|uniref:Uncharacterized protein n=1 Tax=Stylonychia lemnae TaxID=5949 RepID=A0A078AH35_STYLE|nr:UNKNOWN [Stylonychia lemnae]|eukprot:CDW81590.1 UNKNOWN [Stylonychia lemnae]
MTYSGRLFKNYSLRIDLLEVTLLDLALEFEGSTDGWLVEFQQQPRSTDKDWQKQLVLRSTAIIMRLERATKQLKESLGIHLVVVLWNYEIQNGIFKQALVNQLELEFKRGDSKNFTNSPGIQWKDNWTKWKLNQGIPKPQKMRCKNPQPPMQCHLISASLQPIKKDLRQLKIPASLS